MAGWVREWFGAFRRSFPDLRMELVELVAEGDKVVGAPRVLGHPFRA